MLNDHFFTLELTYSVTYTSDPMAAPRYGLSSGVMLMPESANTLVASLSCSCLVTIQGLVWFGKYPKAGPCLANLSVDVQFYQWQRSHLRTRPGHLAFR